MNIHYDKSDRATAVLSVAILAPVGWTDILLLDAKMDPSGEGSRPVFDLPGGWHDLTPDCMRTTSPVVAENLRLGVCFEPSRAVPAKPLTGRLNLQDRKMQDWKMTDKNCKVENDGQIIKVSYVELHNLSLLSRKYWTQVFIKS